MSRVFSLEIVVEDSKLTSSKEIIELLIKHSWKIDKSGEIVFLPLHDDDLYNWTSKKLSIKDFYSILLKKEKHNEIVGVELLDQNSDIGMHLIAKRNNITFIFNINKKYLDDRKLFIDYNWYTNNVLKRVTDQYYVRSYSFNYEA